MSPETKRDSVLRMIRWKLFCCAAINSGQSTSAVDGEAARAVSISICGVVSGAAKSISLRVIINADSLLLHPHGAQSFFFAQEAQYAQAYKNNEIHA